MYNPPWRGRRRLCAATSGPLGSVCTHRPDALTCKHRLEVFDFIQFWVGQVDHTSDVGLDESTGRQDGGETSVRNRLR